jgi:hypothetical protein
VRPALVSWSCPGGEPGEFVVSDDLHPGVAFALERAAAGFGVGVDAATNLELLRGGSVVFGWDRPRIQVGRT